jgi:hypothetical protein
MIGWKNEGWPDMVRGRDEVALRAVNARRLGCGQDAIPSDEALNKTRHNKEDQRRVAPLEVVQLAECPAPSEKPASSAPEVQPTIRPTGETREEP